MDSGNISEVENEVAQPDEAVAVDSEVKSDEPQSEESETELFIEEEGEQKETPKKGGMTDSQQKAAYRQEREKRKADKLRSDKVIAEEKRKNDALEARLRNLERGKQPNIEDYTQENQDKYLADMEKWKGVPSEVKAEEPATLELSDDQAYHLHSNEEDIKKSFKNYDEVKGLARNAFEDIDGVDDSDAAMKQIAAVCHEYDIDPSKVIYSIGKFPSEAKELVKAWGQNDSARRTALRKLEGKVKTRARKKIQSEPEPKIKSNGSIDVGSEAEKKAMKEYIDSGHHIDKYRALKKIRQANKA